MHLKNRPYGRLTGESLMKLDHFGETVRIAVLGLGNRGIGQMKTLLEMKDVDITAVCDGYQDRTDQAAEIVLKARGHRPFATTDCDEAIDRPDVDAVVIMTSWEIVNSGKEYTDDELRKALSGHLCRCTGYENIFRAVKKTMLRHLGKFEEAELVNSQGITEYPDPMPFK